MVQQTVAASFLTRRDADMAVEHLVQEYGIAADAIMVVPASDANSSGVAPSGGDLCDGLGQDAEPKLTGSLIVSAEVEESMVDKISSSFASYGGSLGRSGRS